MTYQISGDEEEQL